MKIHSLISTLSLVGTLAFFSCTRNVTIESDVHPDGSIDRTIVLHEADSAMEKKNILGVNAQQGWDVRKDSSNGKLLITFRKHFASADASNEELNNEADTLFHIRSSFSKQFRWFYTYIKYEDTYASLNRFPGEPANNYLTPEDFAFIQRLPAEGKPMSSADSLYLDQLNHKIYDTYALHTIFTELYNDLDSILKRYHANEMSIQKLHSKRKDLLKALEKDSDTSDYFLLAAVDSLGIPLPKDGRAAYKAKCDELTQRINMASEASTWRVEHIIKMPWTMVSSDADSTSGNTLYWHPPVIKFLLSDYTMSAESRKLNVIPLVISGLIVAVSLFIFVKGRR